MDELAIASAASCRGENIQYTICSISCTVSWELFGACNAMHGSQRARDGENNNEVFLCRGATK